MASNPPTVFPTKSATWVKELKAEAAKAKEVYLATDPDREGEAIAWHLIHAADIDPENHPGAWFSTKSLKQPLRNPSANRCDIDMQLVNAQQARRILDRLVGL